MILVIEKRVLGKRDLGKWERWLFWKMKKRFLGKRKLGKVFLANEKVSSGKRKKCYESVEILGKSDSGKKNSGK